MENQSVKIECIEPLSMHSDGFEQIRGARLRVSWMFFRLANLIRAESGFGAQNYGPTCSKNT